MLLRTLLKAMSLTLAIPILACLLLLTACRKQDNSVCFLPDIFVLRPYSQPAWHPGGTLLGFNHMPLKAITLVREPPCTWYSYTGDFDSTGFYLMNKDKTGLRRVTRFPLKSPAWSPDGKWIAFCREQNIYKMPFNGSSFDATQMIQLTNSAFQSGGGHYNIYPAWTPNSDSIFYSSSENGPPGTNLYAIWKMASDGTGKTKITDATTTGDIRELFLGSDNRIYHTRWVNLQVEIFSMAKDGSNALQLTSTADPKSNMGSRQFPKSYQGKIYYQGSDGIYSFSAGSQPTRIINEPVNTYDISANGEIVYSRFHYSISEKDEQLGTLWITNADGGNRQQLTFNRL
jgi:hypothetical protein